MKREWEKLEGEREEEVKKRMKGMEGGERIEEMKGGVESREKGGVGERIGKWVRVLEGEGVV